MPTLDFKGKQHIYAHHLTVPYRPLVPDAERSLGEAGADDNLIVHGDNLHALKALLPRYAGRVKCVYIDPPYNTGNEGWVYSDRVNSKPMREWLARNGPVDGEDLERHDKWLCMMWPRLHLLKELLAEDGVIFVSIDDNEQHHLRMLMDEIFGEEKFFARIAWESRTKPTNMGAARFNIQSNTESIIVYGKVSMTVHPGFRLYPTDDKEYPHRDDLGKFRLNEFQQRRNIGSLRRDTMVYSIDGISPRDGYRWQVSPGRYQNLRQDELVIVKDNRVFEKIYEHTDKNGSAFEPFWGLISKDIGTSEFGKTELNAILGIDHGLETVKPTELIKKLVFHSTESNALILDSFAGSGTTAHAVLALNKEDGGNRKFILVECEDYADSITAERARRVIRGVPEARDEALREGLGGSFTYCALGDPIELEGMLTGDALPSYSALAAYLLHTAAGLSAGDAALERENADGLFHRGEGTDYYLLYEPDLDWLRGDEGILNAEKAERIGAVCRKEGGKAIVFGPCKYIGQRDLSRMGVTFCQLPYELHRRVVAEA